MFDDLIYSKGGNTYIDYSTADIKCPSCGSEYVESSCGVFVSANRYVQCIFCMDCGFKWKVVYDQDLNVVDVETK